MFNIGYIKLNILVFKKLIF